MAGEPARRRREASSTVELRPVRRCHELGDVGFVALRRDYLTICDSALKALLLEAVNGACSTRLYSLTPTEQHEQLRLLQHAPDRCHLWVERSVEEFREQLPGVGGRNAFLSALRELEEKGYVLRRESANRWSRRFEYLIQPHAIDAAVLAEEPEEGPTTGLSSESSDLNPRESDPKPSTVQPRSVDDPDSNRRASSPGPSTVREGAIESPDEDALSAEEGDRGSKRQEESVERPHTEFLSGPPNLQLVRLGMPESLAGLKLDALAPHITQQALTIAQSVASDGGRGLYISGALASGKSSLAAAVFAELSAARRSRGRPAWVEFPRDALVLEDDHANSDRRELVRALRAKGTLVLDGLSRLGGRQQRDLVAAAIDTRIEAGAALIVTSDDELSAAAEHVGARTAERLASYCSEVVLARRSPERKRRSA